jgi:hypothetical protein
MDVVDFALPLFECFLDNLLLLEIVDLLFNLPPLGPYERLAEHKEEGGRNRLHFTFAVGHFGSIYEL